MLNKDIIEGKWKEVKGEILRTWGELTSDEVDKAKGDLTVLAGRLQKKYGYAKSEVQSRLNEIVKKYDDTTPTQLKNFKGGRIQQDQSDQKW